MVRDDEGANQVRHFVGTPRLVEKHNIPPNHSPRVFQRTLNRGPTAMHGV